MSTHTTVLRRLNDGYRLGYPIIKPITCPECKVIHGERKAKGFTSTKGFFLHYTFQHSIDAEQKDYLQKQIVLFQHSKVTNFQDFLKRGRIE